ncbi:pimeloyl-ACP methyl ester esterase BioH [Solemya velesiana gill symbiont]|uniref:Pimeloyl-[acyl-carrier protein] methyl ester esterase n=1 Tax=Solemya velesiana gill symbiont TaxID=1918948 RepID=A0A1T2KV09_9GAMM|nr:pimeloyl-ACP methyl ester esterase BioH [Solemya velesiana gill symbiont]OOZ36556.1 pimeloyl-[acyl-carrier protein] methyl ester esterase [Solemya velesiana gill symbiont]
MKLYSETTGSGAELVLIHGWGMNAAVWSPLMEHLTVDHRVTVIELPGHGGSEYDANEASLDAWADACLEAAPERAIWVSWSLGGQVAQRAAVMAPQRIEKLALVASTPSFVQREDWPHAMDHDTLGSFAQALVKTPAQTLERFLSLQVRGDEEARHTLRLLRQELTERPEAEPMALEHGLDLLLNVDLRDQLASISCPVLWLLGERDTLVPVGVADELEILQPGADILVLGGCAHAPFLSHTEKSLRALAGFIG